MPQMEKSKLLAFAKKTAKPPMGAKALAEKRKSAAPASDAPSAQAAAPGAPPPAASGAEAPVNLFELVEEAAVAAEAAQDIELEDIIAGTQSTGPDDLPPWAQDPVKWKEAADAVGLGIPGTEDKYDEPVVVAAYLYKMIGGPVTGSADIPPVPDAPLPEADMSKPGAAAKAIQARATTKAAPAAGASKAVAPDAGAKQAAPPAKPAASAAKPATASAPAGDTGELKKILDQAAQQAASSPDPDIIAKMQTEPPAEGQAPSWAADQAMWAKAEEAVKPHWADYPEPFMVVAYVYKSLGGKLQ